MASTAEESGWKDIRTMMNTATRRPNSYIWGNFSRWRSYMGTFMVSWLVPWNSGGPFFQEAPHLLKHPDGNVHVGENSAPLLFSLVVSLRSINLWGLLMQTKLIKNSHKVVSCQLLFILRNLRNNSVYLYVIGFICNFGS